MYTDILLVLRTAHALPVNSSFYIQEIYAIITISLGENNIIILENINLIFSTSGTLKLLTFIMTIGRINQHIFSTFEGFY